MYTYKLLHERRTIVWKMLNAFVWKLLLKFGLNLEYICFEASPFIVANKQDMLSAQCCQPTKTTLE